MAEGLPVRRTPRAEEDLEDVWSYTAGHGSLAQADRYVDALAAAFDTIAHMPDIVRERAEFSTPVRIHPSAQHIIIHRIRGDHIEIVRVARRPAGLARQTEQ